MLPQNYSKDPLLDFRVFLVMVWRHLNLPDPTDIQLDIAKYLMDIYQGRGPRRAVIEAFRGVGKSWITAAFVCWVLYCNPNLKILVVSAAKNLADNFSTFVLQLIRDIPEIQHLMPSSDQRCSKIQFDVGPSTVSRDPSVRSCGITGQLTGSRADILISDDVEVPSNSATQIQREKLQELVKEYDAILKPNGIIIYLGTPQTEMSLYNVLAERGYEIRVWPARYPSEKQCEILGTRLAPKVHKEISKDPSLMPGRSDSKYGNYGAPTDPRRFSHEDLLEREASYGRSGFALQFMLDTSLSDAERYPLRLSDLTIMSLNTDLAPEKVVWASSPELILNELPNVGFNGDKYFRPMAIVGDWVPYTGSVLAIDPAGRGRDETGYAVVNILNSQLFVVELGGLFGGYSEETLKTLAMIAQRNKVNKVIIEANFGDGMYTELIKPYLAKIHPCGIEEVKHSIQKEKRIIDTLEPVMNQHKLIVNKDIIEKDFKSTQHLPPEQGIKYQAFYQMTRITREKGALANDDRLDALAIAVNYWVEAMARDIDDAMQEHKEDKLQKELDKFMEHAIGAKPKAKTWIG